MSTAQRLYGEGWAKGWAKGFAEGWAEGYAKGFAEAQAQTVVKALRYGFGEVGAAVQARVEEGSAEERDRWLQRAFVAKTSDEVFAE